ncbi:MAG: right-handed parallel beta-helix repeat-containing protein [Candidatus Aenigmarchaeota archaeon]|nr:right-handed parallel beta-helix repeat-containing protein [Candidatus Aenigmarchaeota archaeon]
MRRKLIFPVLFLVAVFFTNCQKEKLESSENSNMISSTDPSFRHSKMKIQTNPFLNTEPIQNDRSFDITQNLTPESEVIYQRALSGVIKQLETLRENVKGMQTYTLYPTGMYPDDRINVQTLVNELGDAGIDAKVKLKSTNRDGVPTAFNFGFSTGGGISEGGWVSISTYLGRSGSLEFMGEGKGDEITTISGGFRFPNTQGGSFFIVNRTDDDFIFKGIRFTNEGGIEVARVGSFLAKECLFDNTTIGIDNFGVSNSVTIKDNIFEDILIPMRILNDNPIAVIKDNQVYNAQSGPYFGFNSGSYIVKDNIIRTIDGDDPYATGDGIFVYDNEDLFEIKDNDISCNDPFSAGIFLLDFQNNIKNIFIKDNKIHMNSKYYSAIDIEGYGNSISDICISDNEISGEAASAFYVSSLEAYFPPSDISDISFNNNNIEDFETTCLATDGFGSALGCVDVFFDASTHDLTFCGEVDIIIDQGINNTFTEDDCPKCDDN